ncbi:unnamed protein product [Rhizoctonia solani]|uniref:Fungal lipase-type domain-containing protein n=1 Tax=Rhizoctonia solani TaxID=456999 RepID=A0A8H3A0N0_9AGAM|nr:unnamed protein product [Rhizoctonia solani]CAE6392648.1 unnamed protein product [Rhizoctonia solani]
MFHLALFSFLASEIEGDQAHLQAFAEKKLPELLDKIRDSGKWEIVWGPTVWKHIHKDPKSRGSEGDTAGPDHLTFVARNRNLKFPNGEEKDTYVLAVAGSQTDYNYQVNNFTVDKIVDLHKWLKRGLTTPPEVEISPSPENCYISYGTALGVYQTACVPPPPSAASPGIELASFFANLPESPDTKVIVTGHSLGGPLASTSALALLESGAFAKFTPSNVLVYPTAGSAIGNVVFSKLYSERFPKVPGPTYQVWNCMIVNLRDPVAQAWSVSKTESPLQNLTNIPIIFGEPPIEDVSNGVAYGMGVAMASGISYFPIQAVFFEGNPPKTQPTNLEEFTDALWWQHTEELLALMGMEEITLDLLTGGEEGLRKKSNIERARAQPLMRALMAYRDAQNAKDGRVPEACKQLQALSERMAR